MRRTLLPLLALPLLVTSPAAATCAYAPTGALAGGTVTLPLP